MANEDFEDGENDLEMQINASISGGGETVKVGLRKKQDELVKDLKPRNPEELEEEFKGELVKKDETFSDDSLFQYNPNNLSDVDKVLIRLRNNCVYLSIYHNRRYHFYKNLLFCIFNVPLILLSALNPFFAVGTQKYFTQETISLVNAIISLFCGILTSVELLWQLKERTQRELLSHKEYYKLGLEIFQFLQLDREKKREEEVKFFNKMYHIYIKHIDSGNAINVYRRGFYDQLEYINENDRKRIKEFVRKKIMKDKKVYYFSECCL
jgi:hypothetical protein